MSLRLTNKFKYLSSKFHTSVYTRQNYFDTFKFVERLEKEGFSRQQSEAIMSSLQRVISESMMDLNKMMVSKAEREKVCIVHQVAFHSALIEMTYRPFMHTRLISQNSSLRCN